MRKAVHSVYLRTGYVMVKPEPGRRVRRIAEHVLIVEKVLGHKLRKTARVHHVDGVRDNNENRNLVACDSQRYHLLLHRRAKALRECGHVDWLHCHVCKQWDDPANDMYVRERYNGIWSAHRVCRARYEADRRQRKAA